MTHVEFHDQPLEEILELVWRQEERGDRSVSAILRESRESDTEKILESLTARGLVEVRGEEVSLTPIGQERARVLIRSHRLAERLLSDVLDVPLSESNHQACLLEHILSPSVTDAVCAFLGHPPTCPHGLPVPPGPCCTSRRNGEVKALVVPLADLEPGREARIVFIAPGFADRLDRLGSFGVIPGTVLVLRQKRPSFVLEIGGTALALDHDLADGIYVRREG